jgi:acetyl esterase/lipase
MPKATRRSLVVSAALAPVLASSFVAPGRAAAQEEALTEQPDVPFGEVNGEELLLDVYLPPAGDAPRPAVILIHPGGWIAGNRAEMAYAARELARAGYAAFSIDYRLMNGDPANQWPAQLDDAQRAVRWVRAHAAEYGVDPERVGAYGYSSGAHLAALLGVRETRDNADPELADVSSRVQCVVALSGDLDLMVAQEFAGLTLVLLLGGTPEEQPEVYRDASPLAWVDAEAAPFLLVHGAGDDDLLAEPSRQMVAALYAAEVESVLFTIPGVDHGSTGEWGRVGPLALAFLGMQLHLDG